MSSILGLQREGCPTGCGRSVSAGKLMCGRCWREVPAPLQRDVYSTWRALSSTRRAMLRAVEQSVHAADSRTARDAHLEALAKYVAARDAAIGSIR